MFRKFVTKIVNLTKTLPSHNLKPTETLQKPNLKPTETLPKPNLEITLSNSGEISDFPLRVFTIVGEQGYGKTTLAKKISEYYESQGIPKVIVKTLDDLEKQKCVLIIDDLKEDLTKTIFNTLVEKFRVVRHNQQIIILTHQLVNRIPTDLLKLSEKIILFNTKYNPTSPTEKLNAFIPKSKRADFQEILIRLKPYRYVILKDGELHGEFSNLDIDPIVSDTQGKEIRLINGKANNAKTAKSKTPISLNGEFKALLYQKVPEWDFLTVREKIIVLKQTFPRLKPRIISQIVGTTPQNVWKELSIARREGIIPKTP